MKASIYACVAARSLPGVIPASSGMAYYGIYSAGVAQTASDLADTVKFSFRSANALTANTVLGLDGSDIIYVGTQGQTTTASANSPGAESMTGPAGFTGTFW